MSGVSMRGMIPARTALFAVAVGTVHQQNTYVRPTRTNTPHTPGKSMLGFGCSALSSGSAQFQRAGTRLSVQSALRRVGSGAFPIVALRLDRRASPLLRKKPVCGMDATIKSEHDVNLQHRKEVLENRPGDPATVDRFGGTGRKPGS